MVGVVGAHEGKSYTVIGDTVNVAARLQGAAPVGGVAIGPGTLRGLPGARVRALGAAALKGKRDPRRGVRARTPRLTPRRCLRLQP